MESKMKQFELKLFKANTKLAHPLDVAWGYAEAISDEGISIEDAFTHADKAMYRHKAMLKKSNLS